MFVADLKLIHNFCGRFNAHSLFVWQISCIKFMFVADLKLIHYFCGRFLNSDYVCGRFKAYS